MWDPSLVKVKFKVSASHVLCERPGDGSSFPIVQNSKRIRAEGRSMISHLLLPQHSFDDIFKQTEKDTNRERTEAARDALVRQIYVTGLVIP